MGTENDPKETSYRRLGRDMMLDHVFSAGFDVLDSGVVPSTAASDHLPIWIELEPIGESNDASATPEPEPDAPGEDRMGEAVHLDDHQAGLVRRRRRSTG